MSGQFIFYGAGQYAHENLGKWLKKGVIPVCFADADKSKHFKKMRPRTAAQTEFEVLSLKEALELCPDADIYITVDIEIIPEVYQEIYRYIISQGVSPERVGPVPMAPTGRQCIFYGAGIYASRNLEQWVLYGIFPVCFADSNETRHNTKMRIPVSINMEFDILPVFDALDRYPEAFIYITTDPKTYDNVYDFLVSEGVSAERIGAPPMNCPFIGRLISVKYPNLATCCDNDYSELIPIVGNIGENVRKYYEYCEQLKNELNEGRLTSCTGCPALRPGCSEEKHKIREVYFAHGLSGATNCNFKCCYCGAGLHYSKKYKEQSENIIDIMRWFVENEDVKIAYYSSGEISVSPYKSEIIKLLRESGWEGEVFTNAFIYVEELSDLLAEMKYKLNVSLDSGTTESFAKIKGVDGFERVVKNIEKYASSGGKIRLKYIVLEGINCEKPDLDGFIQIAKNINALVDVSWDNQKIFSSYSETQYEAVLYLVKQCIAHNIPYCFRYNTKEYIERLQNDLGDVFMKTKF